MLNFFWRKEKKQNQKFLGWDATKVANHSSKCTKLDITVEMKVADVRWINNTFELSTSYLGKVQSAMAYFKMYSIK